MFETLRKYAKEEIRFTRIEWKLFKEVQSMAYEDRMKEVIDYYLDRIFVMLVPDCCPQNEVMEDSDVMDLIREEDQNIQR